MAAAESKMGQNNIAPANYLRSKTYPSLPILERGVVNGRIMSQNASTRVEYDHGNHIVAHPLSAQNPTAHQVSHATCGTCSKHLVSLVLLARAGLRRTRRRALAVDLTVGRRGYVSDTPLLPSSVLSYIVNFVFIFLE